MDLASSVRVGAELINYTCTSNLPDRGAIQAVIGAAV